MVKVNNTYSSEKYWYKFNPSVIFGEKKKVVSHLNENNIESAFYII